MTYRRWLAPLFVLVVAAATPPIQADVAPFPSWRVEVNGSIAQSVQIGQTVFVGGGFTKIGPATAPFSAMFDPAALTFAAVSGCARQGQVQMVPGVTAVGNPAVLADGNGPFPLPPGTSMVRIGADCRFDRRFRLALPSGIRLWPEFGGEIVEALGRVYFQVATGSASTATHLVEADGTTGAILRHWPVDPAARYRLRGAVPGGRLLVTTGAFQLPDGLGWVDPAQGAAFHLVRALPVNTFSNVEAGHVVILSMGTTVASTQEIIALDAATLTPLPNWPAVRASGRPIAASGSSGLFLAGQGLTVDGTPAPRVVAFDAVTGARLAGFTPPPWMNEVGVGFTSLAVAGGRLVVFGEFAPGAPRDTAAALDATTGALDPWTQPYVTTFGGWPVGALRFFPIVTARDRVARANLAAIHAQTGQVLPWMADSAAVSALAADDGAGLVYVASSGQVRRYDATTGAIDPTWTFDVMPQPGAPTAITGLALGSGRVYAIGNFSQARDGAAAPWQPREAAAAMTLAGTLSPWRPALRPGCTPALRPPPFPVACVQSVRLSQGRVFLQGTLIPAFGTGAARSLLAVTADTGAIDPVLPEVPVSMVHEIDASPVDLFADASIGGTRYLVRVNAASGPRLLAPVQATVGGQSLAAFNDRLYLDVERDAATGVPTGNAVAWQAPAAGITGVADRGDGRSLSWYAGLASRAPQAPVGLTGSVDGSRVTLRWSPGAGDLAPFAGAFADASAATSHVVLASLASGGPVVASLDTGSADTSFTIAAPTGTFFLRVQASNAFGTSAPSAEVRVDVQPAPPGPPVATTGTVLSRAVQVVWEAPAGGWPATGYLLEAGTAPGRADLGTVPLAATSFQASAPPGRYYVRVRAVNAHGIGPAGDELVLDVQ
jgi:hypothetical protein